MPINKNAIIRYKILDKLLRDRYHYYSLDDLTQEVNRRLSEINPDGDNIVRRTIEKDIRFLEYEPFYAEIERYSVDCYNGETQKTVKKRCLRYANPSFTIFKNELSEEEKYLLREILSLLGQFDGLPELDELERLRLGLGSRKNVKPIISLSKNPLEKTTLFGELFTAISNRQVIELHYHKFSTPDLDQVYNLYPYMLKEYNGRWYLFAVRVENNKIKCYPLDRIDRIEYKPSIKYKNYDGDLNEIFEDVVGVTIYENEEVNKIIFWVSDVSKDYVCTKPLHESQIAYNKQKSDQLRCQYPMLQGGMFFRIDCKCNYELIRLLSSFGKELLVLEPSYIQDKVYERVKAMNEDYEKIRTKRS